MLDSQEVRALSSTNKRDPCSVEVIFERLKKTKSRKRTLQTDNVDAYLTWLAKFAKDIPVKELYSGQTEAVLRSLRAIRAHISASKSLAISATIDLQLLPRIVECLQLGEVDVEFEAAWVLTNLALGTPVHTRYLVEAGAVAGLVSLLQSGSEKVRLQAVWALANIAGDLEDFRRHVLEQGALTGVVRVLSFTKRQAARLKCTWALENLCSSHSDPDNLIQVWPAIRDLLRQENEDLDLAAFKILAKISIQAELAKEMVDGGILADIQVYLAVDKAVCSHALKVIANIANTTYKQKLLDKNILQTLVFMMDTADSKLLYYIGEIILNLTKGNIDQIQVVLESKLLELFWKEVKEKGDEKIQSQVVCIILNILNKGSCLQKKYIFDSGVIKDLSFVLESKSDFVLYQTLCCLEKFLAFGERESKNNLKLNQVACELVNCGGLETLEELMSHESEDVYHKAYDIMEVFFDESDRTEFDLEEMYEKSINTSS